MTLPFEATQEMVKAALDLVWEESETHGDLVCRLWRAMAVVAPDPSYAARELALEEAARNLIANRFDYYKARNGKLCSIEGDDGEKCWIVSFDDMAELESALSFPDHADAGKVEGDGRDDLERFWRPIAEADKSITFERTFDLGDGEKMTIRNSDHYWVRDADGRIYEVTWSDHKGGYWWDLEGESPVDPVEYMPHPLSLPSAPSSEESKP